MIRDAESEKKRRRLELLFLFPLGLFFILLNWLLFRLYNVSSELPLSYALFFFGIVNLNVLVFLAIIFFLGRNLVKIYADSKPRMIGRTLKTRLFLAFISFAFIPTSLMFLVSVFYINNSFDKWFSGRMEDTLKHSSNLASYYISDVRKETFYVAKQVAPKIFDGEKLDKNPILKEELLRFGVDALEHYDAEAKSRTEEVFNEKEGFYLPPLSWDEVSKYIKAAKTKSLSRKTEQGEWLSTLVVDEDQNEILVTSRILPFTLLDTLESIAVARSDYQTSKEFKFPLKSTYLFILVTMTAVILAFGGWFSLYMAQSLSKSLFALGLATKRISKGEFRPIKFNTGMDEIDELVGNFNTMTKELKLTRESLNLSIDNLKRHSIYRNTLLAQISSGVISCDNNFRITLINKRTQNIFNIKSHEVEGKRLQDVFPEEMVKLTQDFSAGEDEVVVHELDIELSKKNILPLQVSISSLFGVKNEKIGLIITVEKVELLRENQRVKAWKEVATRVAHEIKNPLTPVKLSAERLQRKFGGEIQDPAFKTCTSTIISQVDLIRDLVNEFNQFARFPKINLVKVQFLDFLQEIISLYKSSHPEIVFDCVCGEKIEVVIDKDQFKRVFINLFENSIEAMKGQKSKDKKISIRVTASQSGKVALIKTYDSGPGISREKRAEVFKSKYTTKANSDGLGLSIVKKIVEDHGGRISIVDGEESPSVFLIELSGLVVKA